MNENNTISNTSMNVSLPETLKEYVQERVSEGRYSNPSDYVRSLIREDMHRHAERQLETLLLEPDSISNELIMFWLVFAKVA